MAAITVTSTPVQIATGAATKIIVRNNDETNPVYYGTTNEVSSSTGVPIKAGEVWVNDSDLRELPGVWLVSAGSVAVRWDVS